MRGGRGASRVAGGPVVWWRDDKRHSRGEGPTQGLGAKGTRGECTSNMPPMFLTLEVSQPEMSALKFPKLKKSWRMSVMAETHQSAMGPYFAMAEAAFELNFLTAVFREALVVKVSTMHAQLPGAQPEP